MAKAIYHKGQRVFVKPVGTWARIEQVVPQWAKGVEEPIKVTYDVAMGREFGGEELQAEEVATLRDLSIGSENWRLIRGQNKWMSQEECSSHPYPGTYPVVVTNERDWGGWRVPGAEYDHDPHKIEMQARVIANSLKMTAVIKRLLAYGEEAPENLSNIMMDMVQDARRIMSELERA